ncbi:MAG: hypothetical protein A3G77_11725 [Acidobacteria bacterium RIFCSPLOWO2_12_FULL_68_19]|nr:MAG: hypothetical protein A3G77_11725 [Acidobacteria bacterium RIFCSPLOWO2_12_FULL_68_19]
MRPAALVLMVAAPSFAQEWIEYASRQDFFSVNFPGQPAIGALTYETEYGLKLPGRAYRVENAAGRYSATVVDYTNAETMHAERAAACKAAGAYPDICNNAGRADLRGAAVHASFGLIRRGSEVTYLASYNADLVEGIRLQLLNKDGSSTFAVIHMHEYRLYILEGTVPAGMPPPALFQQSLVFLDKEGQRIRYETPYSHGYPVPRRTR